MKFVKIQELVENRNSHPRNQMKCKLRALLKMPLKHECPIKEKYRGNLQGPPTLGGFFNLVILGTSKAATMLYLGSN